MTFIIVHQIAARLHVAEAVRLIQLGNGSDVTAELAGTEASGRGKGGGLDADAATQQIVTKVVITRKGHTHQPVVRAQFHTVGDHFRAALLAFRRIFRSREIDLRVEITLPLHVIAQIASPFLKQILVDGAFLVDGKQRT